MTRWLWLVLLVALPSFGQVFPPPGGGGSLPTASAAGQVPTSVAAGTTYTAQTPSSGGALNAAINLSCASDLGAQIATAVTTLGSKGLIVLPNCTTATMTTTTGAIPPGISIIGYGKLATIINCTVSGGDCFNFTMNPTTAGEIASEIADFQIDGSATLTQTLMHFHGASGYTLHDLQFEPYAGSTSAATTCLEFDNAATGQFTEGNRTYNLYMERQCQTPILFNQNSADTSNSFGYNTFEFHIVAQGVYGITFQGNGSSTTAFLYNGSLTVYENHVGPNGGVLAFLGGFSTDLSLGIANEKIYITAEENGTGAGTVLYVGTGSTLHFYGNIVQGNYNGSGGSLATLYSVNGTGQLTLTTDVQQDSKGNWYMNNVGTSTGGGLEITGVYTGAALGPVGLDVVAVPGQTYGGWQVDASGISGAQWQGMANNNKNFTLFDLTDNTQPLSLVPTPTTFANLVKTGANSQFCWDATAQYSNQSITCDTGISRTAAGAIALGNGTQGNSSAALSVGKINVLAARKGTFTCTAAGSIVVANTNYVTTSDVVITMNTAGGTITTPPAFKTTTSGTGFTMLCGATDTSVYNYDILN